MHHSIVITSRKRMLKLTLYMAVLNSLVTTKFSESTLLFTDCVYFNGKRLIPKQVSEFEQKIRNILVYLRRILIQQQAASVDKIKFSCYFFFSAFMFCACQSLDISMFTSICHVATQLYQFLIIVLGGILPATLIKICKKKANKLALLLLFL